MTRGGRGAQYFECNYAGTGAAWLDAYFGSFVGAWKAGDGDGKGPVKAWPDPKSTLRGGPTAEFAACARRARCACAFPEWAAPFDACAPLYVT